MSRAQACVWVSCLLVCGCDPPVSPKNTAGKPCTVVARGASDEALAKAYAATQHTLIVAGELVLSCECGPKAKEQTKLGGATETGKVSGATEAPKIGGASEASKIGGATEASKLGGATEGTQIGGATEATRVGGASEAPKISGATEGSKIGGATEGVRVSGSTEAAKIGGATEGARFGGAVEGPAVAGAMVDFTCSEAPGCGGFVFSGTPTAVYDGHTRKPTSSSCIVP
jgi:hypothetical protein